MRRHSVRGAGEITGKLVKLGRITRPHGVKGELRVVLYGRDPDNLIAQEEVWLVGTEGPRPGRMEWVRPVSGGALVKLLGVDDPEAGRRLAGIEIAVPRAALAEPEDGEYYWVDLIGLKVRDESGAELGRVVDLMETPAHDVLVIEDGRGGETLVPAVEPLVTRVDLAAGIITVRRPEYLAPEDGSPADAL